MALSLDFRLKTAHMSIYLVAAFWGTYGLKTDVAPPRSCEMACEIVGYGWASASQPFAPAGHQ